MNDRFATALGSERIRECVEDDGIYLIRFAQALRFGHKMIQSIAPVANLRRERRSNTTSLAVLAGNR